MGTGEEPADQYTLAMDETSKRQLTVDQRSLPRGAGNTYYSYDITNEDPEPSTRAIAVADWAGHQQVDQLEDPVWMVPYMQETAIMGYGQTWPAPGHNGSLVRLFDDPWASRQMKRGRWRSPRDIEVEKEPRSCLREFVVFFGGFVILAIALAVIIAIVYVHKGR